MGTIIKYNDKLIQCCNLEKKLKKLKINKDDIEIIKDNIPNDSLESEFVNLTKKEKIEKDPDIVKYYIFKKITFPLSLPGVLSGITMVFMPAVSTFVISNLLGGGQYMLIGNLIETQFTTMSNWNFGSAISIIMMIIIGNK